MFDNISVAVGEYFKCLDFKYTTISYFPFIKWVGSSFQQIQSYPCIKIWNEFTLCLSVPRPLLMKQAYVLTFLQTQRHLNVTGISLDLRYVGLQMQEVTYTNIKRFCFEFYTIHSSFIVGKYLVQRCIFNLHLKIKLIKCLV